MGRYHRLGGRHRLGVRHRRGSVLIVTALSMILLLGCCAITVDYGLLVSDANRLQRALDAAALAGVQELKQVNDGPDEVRARTAAQDTAAQNSVAIDKNQEVTFSNNSTTITVAHTLERSYLFAGIFALISPDAAQSGKVARSATARVTSCAALLTPRVVPIGITWDTYGGLDPQGFDHPYGYKGDWVQNQKFIDQPGRMTYRVLTLTRQNATLFGKDDFVLFDLRNNTSKSGSHFMSQLIGDDLAKALSSIGDYETTLNSAAGSQEGFLSNAFANIFQRATLAPWFDTNDGVILNAIGVRYPNILAGNSPRDGNSKPNPRIMNLIVTPTPGTMPLNGTWNTQIQGYAPVYVRRFFTEIDSFSGETLYKIEVGFLPPQSNSNGECKASEPGIAITGQRVIGLTS